jgi:AraC family transcriptional activator of pobA
MPPSAISHSHHTLQQAASAPPASVPKVRLYVERADPQETWFVNVGHVTEGGRRWTAPHAHPAYGQVIYVRVGQGTINLEGSVIPFQGPCALLLPNDCVHGLEYTVDVDRWVVTIEDTYLKQVNAKLPEFSQLWSGPRVIGLGYAEDSGAHFGDLVRQLQYESRSRTIGHVIGTEALLTQLLLILIRGLRSDQIEQEGATRNAIRLTDRFRELVRDHYRDNLRLQDYASMMAVSATQLRAACIAATGMSPTKMIHARLVTEAKRSLIFSDMTIEQIAYALGFVDSAYFTRFFRREAGQSPSQFRAQAREHKSAQ